VRRSALLPALFALAACGPAVPAVEAPPPTAVAVPAPPVPRPLAIDDDPSAAARIAADVTYLASPELGGRGTGEDGARLAADFVTRRFAELKLAPAGSEHAASPYLQAFSARVGATVKEAALEVTPSRGNVAGDGSRVTAADGAASGTAHGKAVFVGFGITAAAVGWDDYAGADLEGKIAIVLDGVPAAEDAAKKPAAAASPVEKALRDFGSVRYKLRTAREHKAVGAVIVRAGEELQNAPLTDASSMGIPAVVVTRGYAQRLFPKLRLREARTWRPAKATKAAKPAALPPDEVRVTTQIVPVEATAWNVAALLPAREGSPRAGEVVVVGAHYDHLGHGSAFSLAPGVAAIHPGADDNASGTALLLEVARRFAALPTAPDRGVLFLAFGAEEIGTIGSRYWVEHPTVPRDHVVAMINADMVGRLRDDRLIVDGVGTATGWKPLIDAAAQGLGLDLAFGAEGFGASDHASFTAVRVPVAFFFTGVHPDYHRPSDTADKINAAGEERVVTLAGRLALAVAQAPSPLVFVDAPADPHRAGRGGFKVSLGTIPDYGFAGKGVRLDGVRPDAPAARAGLARGDVIVKVGPHDVANIHDYMFALGDLEAGREVVVEVEREGKRLPLKVVPAPGR
jgi:Zn-dependent M28 family amino/carboxypeptidase